ncbi:unnamed protein product [Heterobilharzia americana]|nr:unnamed protein product [Heterobilharzia americana]
MLPTLEEISLNCQLQNEAYLFKLYNETQWSLDEKAESNQMNETDLISLSTEENNIEEESLASLVNKTSIQNDNQACRTDGLDDRTWHSTSPCSSESADSFSSARNDLRGYLENSLSPKSTLNSKCTNMELISSELLSEFMNIDNMTPMNILSISNHFENTLDTSLFYADCLTHDDNYSSFSNDYVNKDDQKRNSEEILYSKECKEGDLLKLHQVDELDSIDNTSQGIRKQLLKSGNDKIHLNTSPVSLLSMDTFSCIHSPSELDKQLASEDIAWMDTLDVSGLGLDDVEQIFSTVNSTEEICRQTGYCTPKYHSNNEALPSTSNDLQHESLIISRNCKLKEVDVISEKEKTTEVSTCKRSVVYIDSQEEKYTGHNSDSTLTCSEAEYHHNLIRQKCLKKRRLTKRKSKQCSYVASDEYDSDSSLNDTESLSGNSYNPRSYRNNNNNNNLSKKISHPTVNSQHRNKHLPHYNQSSSDVNEFEPWWPNPVTRRMYKDFQSNIWLTNSTNCDYNKRLTKYKSSSFPDQLMYNSNLQKSNSSTDQHQNNLYHRYSHQKCIKKIKYSKQIKSFNSSINSYWSIKRKSKQMELWQFILCRLETAKRTAFQWVNRSTGIFRIVNTQSSAKEWGHYRNNKQMDYEKMARAMRLKHINRQACPADESQIGQNMYHC